MGGGRRVERSGRRIELRDRRRREELIGVQFAHGFTAGQIDDENSPMRLLVFGRMNDRPDLAFKPLAGVSRSGVDDRRQGAKNGARHESAEGGPTDGDRRSATLDRSFLL